MWAYLVVGIPTFLVLKFMLSTNKSPVLGIYSQEGKWFRLKYWVFYLMFTLRKRQNAKAKTVEGKEAGYGMRSRSSVEEMEKPQVLPKEHPEAVDAVYFNGGNADGQYFVCATARRHNKLTQTLLYIRIPGLGLLELPTLPDTCLYREEELSYATNGIKIEPVEPMKKWKLSYNGKMRLLKVDGEQEEVAVSYSLDWTAYTRYFDFDTDLDVWAMCEAMAREPWSREYFDMLKKAHQTHYEQFGEITGTVKIEGYGDKEIKVQGVRDHSYGNIRDWADLHRYAIQYFHLANGSAVCVGNICFPKTMTRLIIGYIFHPDGRMDTVSATSLELYEHGEDGNDPDHIQFNFTAGGRMYQLQCDVLDRPKFYMGYEWEARIHERMCRFRVNGVQGWGISEWDYRNKTGRPSIYPKKPATK